MSMSKNKWRLGFNMLRRHGQDVATEFTTSSFPFGPTERSSRNRTARLFVVVVVFLACRNRITKIRKENRRRWFWQQPRARYIISALVPNFIYTFSRLINCAHHLIHCRKLNCTLRPIRSARRTITKKETKQNKTFLRSLSWDEHFFHSGKITEDYCGKTWSNLTYQRGMKKSKTLRLVLSCGGSLWPLCERKRRSRDVITRQWCVKCQGNESTCTEHRKSLFTYTRFLDY